MAYAHYDRLTALDVSFLRYEEQDPNVHMHVGVVALFERGALAADEAGVDIGRIRRAVESSLGESPRFRQKLVRVPRFDLPVWVDDPCFNLEYHVRHTALPHPGSLRQLKRLAGRIFSQKLDRSKPLWEFWFVEGLEDGRFALIAKAHHCLVDGISGFELLARMMRLDPDPTIEAPKTWIPRPAPETRRLFVDEASRRGSLPFQIAAAGARALAEPQASAERLRDAAGALYEAFSANLSPCSPTPLNVEIGPYRRFDWTRFDLAAAREIRGKLEGTVNDVVLCAVAGAVGRFLAQRGERISQLEFRAMVPVSVRRSEERGSEGNRVVSLMAELPIDEPDPRRRFARVAATTRGLKNSRQARGVEIFEEISDKTSPELFVAVSRRTARQAYNLVVTNVPGPPATVWFAGAKMQEIYPLVPIFVDNALGIALFSYDGGLYWGFNADWDALPDLHDFVDLIDAEFEALQKAAALGPLPPE
ncbi:MAG: WS/DGAT/MGAT family O-acyltransferase [Myxococcota bacterium]